MIIKVIYALAALTFLFPGAIAILNLIKEGFSLYWAQFMAPSVLFFLMAVYLSKKRQNQGEN